jgi:hypothetical protein
MEAVREMTSPSAEQRANQEHGASDRTLSMAVVVMLVSLAVLFGLIVPIAIYLLHRASGF